MCGVIGVVGLDEAAKDVFLGLITLQHRGQDAAGILSFDFKAQTSQNLHLTKNIGLVESVFNREQIENLKGSFAIGHTRYSTIGKGVLSEVQPFLSNYPYGIGIVHNGNIANYPKIKDKLKEEMRVRCLTGSDTEAILNWISQKLEGTSFEHITKAVQSVFNEVSGSYSIVGLIAEAGLIAFRDVHGIRPLLLGKKIVDGKNVYMVASETSPMSFLGYTVERNLEPGEILFIDKSSKLHSKILTSKLDGKSDARPCMFEWVYFASAESEIEGAPVHGTRLMLGKNLSKIIRDKMRKGEVSADVVIPVPDTARPAATAIAEELGIPYRDVLIKNRYITRTFILGSQSKREKAVDLKLHPIKSEIKGKNVILVDDSIVRGTTSKKLVQLVRDAGANKVYFVSTCPPIRNACFYGIDFPDVAELIAGGKELKDEADSIEDLEKKVAQSIGADGVVYQTIEGLKSAISISSNSKVKNPCMACLNGKYPTEVSEAKRFVELRKQERAGHS